MAKGPEIPKTDSAEIEILIERLKQNKCTLSANVLDNGWYVNIHCQTHLPKGYSGTGRRIG